MAFMMSSCDSMIYDDQGDCSVHYRIHLRYTKNILNADAFGSQVTDVNVALYDQSGNLVLHKSEKRSLTVDNDYYMDVDVLPGTYDILAWCGGKSTVQDAVSFAIENNNAGMNITQCYSELPLDNREESLYSESDIDRWFHGLSSDVVFADSYGIIDIPPVYLTKDTNHLTVVLQNLDGSELDPSTYNFTLEGKNSKLDWHNDLIGDTKFEYIPWSKRSIVAGYESSTKADGDLPDGILAEFTTGRILHDVEQKLTVKNTETGDVIFSIPLVEYLLLVRSNYEQMTSDQDYLDRFDDFSLVFFLQGGTWMKSRILINGWRIVPPQGGIL